MAKKSVILAFILTFMCIRGVYADTVTPCFNYSVGSEVTDVNLNCNFNTIRNVINGGLDNQNANTSGGYWFIQVLGSLPAAGNQGRVVFLTADNTLNFDTGSQFAIVPSVIGPAVSGDFIFYDGSVWKRVAAGTSGHPLITKGSGGTDPIFEQLDLTVGVQNNLPIGNGGTSANLSDPGADRIFFWDESGNVGNFLNPSPALSITTTSTNLNSEVKAVAIQETDQSLALNGSWSDVSGFSLSITLPVTSTVEVIANVSGYKSTDDNNLAYRLVRDSTAIDTGDTFDTATYDLTDIQGWKSYLGASDSALSAATYTYKIQVFSDDGGTRTYSTQGNMIAVAMPD